MPTRSILWFRKDLRLHDNPVMHKALQESEVLLPVYCIDPDWFRELPLGFRKTGGDRHPFPRCAHAADESDGLHVQHWLPELSELPAPKIYAPFSMDEEEQAQYGLQIGKDYPAPEKISSKLEWAVKRI